MGYKLSLSNDDICALEWLAQRGYFPDEILRGMTLEEGQPDDDDNRSNLERVYLIPEHIAWSLIDLRESDPDAYLACMGGTLLPKILKLEMEIV